MQTIKLPTPEDKERDTKALMRAFEWLQDHNMSAFVWMDCMIMQVPMTKDYRISVSFSRFTIGEYFCETVMKYKGHIIYPTDLGYEDILKFESLDQLTDHIIYMIKMFSGNVGWTACYEESKRIDKIRSKNIK